MGTGNMEFDNVQLDVEFSQASERDNISSRENIALSFGKLSTWFEALVPEGGSSGQILGWKSSGTAEWINSPASIDEKVKVDKFVSTTQTDYLLTGAVASMATTAGHLVVDNADGVASARMRLQKGTTDTIGQSMIMLGNNIPSGTSKNMQGMILMYSSSDKYGKIVSESLTDDRTWTLPDKTGTIAMTSDITPVNNGKLTIKGGTTSVAEFTANQSSNTDFSIVAGSNVTVTPDATNHKITIASSHPTYTRTDTTSTASPAHGETFTAIDSVTSANGHVTAVNVKTVTLPAQYVHPGKTQTDTTSTASPAHGGTFTVVDSVTRDTSGHVSGINVKTVTLPSDQNTDTLMTQTNTTASADYRVLLSGNANDTTETTTGRKSTNLRFNPSSGGLYSFGFLWTDITGQTLDIDTLTLSDGTLHSRRFIQKTDGGADNITNIPVAGHPFLLEVDLIRWASTTDYITRQRFTNAANATYSYVRYCTRGTWGNWTTRKYTDTNTKVTSAANHYTPATASGGDISESASGATAAWSIDVVKGVTLQTDGKGHVTGLSVTSGKIPANPNTDTKVTSADNHYTPATVSGQDKSASASGATAAWSIDVVKGVTLNTDGKGHVTGLSVTSGKIPANPVPSNNVTGSGTSGYLTKWNGTNTITNGPQLGSSTTTYLRNDGTWATPTNTNTTYTLGTSGNNVTLTPSSGNVQSITVPYATNAATSDSLKITGYGTGNLTFYQANDDFGGTEGRKGNNADNYWSHYIIANHGNGETYYHYTLRLPFWGSPQYQRKIGGSTATANRTRWLDIITEENYTDYTVTKTGGGASGSWGISITGNASTSTKATQDESGNNIKATYAASFSISDHTITLKNKNGGSLGTVTVPDNNTTYTIATGDSNGQIKVTPSGGTAYNVSVKGLASAAYVTQESLLRARSSVTTDGGATGWSQIGINQYNNAYPDGVTNKIYSYGAVVSMPAPNARFDLYYNHNSSTAGAITNGLQYRTGWDNDKKAWRMLLDNGNYTSYTYSATASRTANTVLAAPNGSNGEATFRKLVAADIPSLNYVPNTNAGVNAAINLLTTGSSNPTLTDYYIAQYAGGGTTTTTYHRRPISALWNTFKELITLTTAGSGNAVTAVSIANDGDHNRKITVTKGSTFSLSTHTHSNYLPMSTVSSSTDADTLFTTSQWINWNTTTEVETTHMPTTNYGILLAKAYPGIQVFIPDSAAGIYFRKKTNANTAATAWWGITGTAGNTYNLNNFLPLSGGTMTGTIQGTYSNTHIALAGGGIGDYATLDHKNNINISSWYGVSISNGCSQAGTLDQVTFSVNARTGATQQRGDAILYSAGGDSPALIFQRGTFVDNLNDWKIYVSGGALYFAQSTANASSETWTNKMYFHASDGNLYVGSTKVSLNGHTHNYAGSSSAGGPATNVELPRVTADAKSFPGQNKVGFREYSNTSTNTPSSAWYHIISMQGADTRYGTQLALGMTTNAVYYRNYNNSTWIDWQPLGRFTATPTSGQVVIADGTAGAIKSSGYTIATSVPSGAVFTDANVTQTPADSTYTNYRPLLIGNSSGTSAGFTPTLTTAGTYTTAGIYCQPSSGYLYASDFMTNTYPSATGSSLSHYGLYLKSYKKASLPEGGDYSYPRYVVRTYDGKAGDSSGMVLTMDGGGLTIVGGGESAVALANLISDDQRDANTSRTRLNVGGTLNTAFHGSSEQLILSSDNNIYFLTACNTISGRKPVCLDTSSYFYPGTNKTGSIGTSSYMWNSVYAATIYENGTSLANKYVPSHGNLNGTIGANSPAADVKTFFMTSSVPTATSSIGYNTAGNEYTLIFGKGANTAGYGAVLRFGYDSLYPELLRVQNGTWKSTDWEKISAGYADIAGNVSGTVAIAHGGTGATDRLTALKNLTNENVGTSATYFLTITNSWGKGGYTTVAQAKTVLGMGTLASRSYVEITSITTVTSGKKYTCTANTQTYKTFMVEFSYGSTSMVQWFTVTGTTAAYYPIFASMSTDAEAVLSVQCGVSTSATITFTFSNGANSPVVEKVVGFNFGG